MTRTYIDLEICNRYMSYEQNRILYEMTICFGYKIMLTDELETCKFRF